MLVRNHLDVPRDCPVPGDEAPGKLDCNPPAFSCHCEYPFSPPKVRRNGVTGIDLGVYSIAVTNPYPF